MRVILHHTRTPADVIGFGHGARGLGKSDEPPKRKVGRGKRHLRQCNALTSGHCFDRGTGKQVDRGRTLRGLWQPLRREPCAHPRNAAVGWPPIDIQPRQVRQASRVKRLRMGFEEFRGADRKTNILIQRPCMGELLRNNTIGQAEHVIEKFRLRLSMGRLKPDGGGAKAGLKLE